jgi:[acyl-carrier-protein] S-malonyltransferase
MSAVSDTLFKDWKATNTFLFPGQGAQYVGMAGKLVAEVPKAKEMFQQASEVLGYDLLKLCLEGPKDKLDSTVISQPAIYVASLAAVEKLRNDAGQAVIDKATVAAGLSLGEYTALSFAGALSFEDGLRIVKTRGEAMQAASEAAESGMVSVIGLDIETVEKLCARTRELTGARTTLYYHILYTFIINFIYHIVLSYAYNLPNTATPSPRALSSILCFRTALGELGAD